MTDLPSLLLVGGGRMGGAMLAGWRERGLSQAVVVDPSPEAAKLAGPGVTVVPAAAAIPSGFAPAAVVLAVKPQMAAEALPAYARYAGQAVFISIMAGKTVDAVSRMLAAPAAIVRAMPNTPAAVRQGITVAYAAAAVTPAQKTLADTLLAATGEIAWVAQEGLLDPVTAISGGGPAYVFLLTELMEQAGLDQGLPPALARQMARQTVIGSAALLAASDEDAAQLRIAVTSPKGTTERALAVLRADDAWPKTFKQAIQAATERSRELSS
ncbi:pyrroline-5-carboxylate reductase [Acidocella sp. KAb 2-4]|uniref:pyrroline-5-carboxylate reductase n=1 Tax=Acidocella sp. KAb 2-4 TaxID=2885158 RepID=UPI001D09510F|nr:pyrroline-5-carboxylate reductase [Acidocella sp. KAb 2-4]MCB5945276.1 pyrroline-5-carboxylate reductase [Acidocella sp. KAb 2-4]